MSGVGSLSELSLRQVAFGHTIALMEQAAAGGGGIWRLRTFGGLSIEKSNPAATPSARRRPLVLLALLAIAGERGLSREKLVAFLWPESDEERGRNSLSQALAALRRDLASDDPVVGTTELRLNPAVITSDVAEFERDVSSGALERAVAQYQGPFLDGVFVREAADFERWADQHRRRLHDMFADALRRLACAADEHGDRERAVTWWKRLAVAEPTNAQAVSGLMRTLAMTGDRAGAHRQYQVYERLMQQEFGDGPEPAVAALHASLFAESADRAIPVTGVAPSVEAVVVPAASLPPSASPKGGRQLSPRVAFMTGAAMLVVVMALLAWRPTHSPTLESRRIAVAPFRDLTNDTALAQVGRIAADWITQGISQIHSLDVVPSTAVSAALNDAGRGSDVVRRLATVTHADFVVTGSVVASGDSLLISATVIDARNNKPIRVIESVAGPASDPLIAISALRERLLGSLAGGDATRGVSLGSVAPRYDAYRAAVEGSNQAYGRNDREALPFFLRAVQLDSDFVGAHLSLAWTYANLGLLDSAERELASLDRLRDRLRARLSVTDELLVDAFRAEYSGDIEPALRLEEQYIARDSAPATLFQAGYSAKRLLRPKEAIALLRASDSAMIARGFAGQIATLSKAYHEAGDFGAELSTIERGRKLIPADRLDAGMELAAYAGLRRSTSALALADTLVAGISDSDVRPLLSTVVGALEFRTHGDDATAALLARRVTSWGAAHPAPPGRLRDVAIAYGWLILRQLDSAENHCRRAAQDSLVSASVSWQTVPPLSVAGLLAVISARHGDTLRARATADSLAALESPRTAGLRDYWRAAILGQLGEREQAVTLLRQSMHEAQNESMDRWHYSEALRALHGYPPFDQLITPKG